MTTRETDRPLQRLWVSARPVSFVTLETYTTPGDTTVDGSRGASGFTPERYAEHINKLPDYIIRVTVKGLASNPMIDISRLGRNS